MKNKEWIALVRSLDYSTAGRFETMNSETGSEKWAEWEKVEQTFNISNATEIKVERKYDKLNWREVIYVETAGKRRELCNITIGGWTEFYISSFSDDELIKLKPVINVLIKQSVPMMSKDGTGKLYAETFLKKVEIEND